MCVWEGMVYVYMEKPKEDVVCCSVSHHCIPLRQPLTESGARLAVSRSQ